MKKSLRNLLIGAGMALSSAGCGIKLVNQEDFTRTGVIEKKSFYAGQNKPDRYTALIRTSNGQILAANNFENEARVADLRYDVGDTVKVLWIKGRAFTREYDTDWEIILK